jgi:hypothetical protein
MNANELADGLDKIWDNECRSPIVSKSADMLRQQEKEINELQNFAIWMSGCGYDFKQIPYFNNCMDSLVLKKASEK